MIHVFYFSAKNTTIKSSIDVISYTESECNLFLLQALYIILDSERSYT